jgi:phosphonate degradation associated HDIG domain protein
LFDKYGRADYIGEKISQIEHAYQAAQAAEKDGWDDEVVLAALFHDIGHICINEEQYHDMGVFGNQEHEKVGKEYLLRHGFSQKIADLAGNHVTAKRYLTYKYPEYLAKLSEASIKTLAYQGGPMNAQEAEAFEKDPLFKASLKLREYDEMAKEENVPLPDAEYYKHMAKRHLLGQMEHVL